MGVTDGGWVSGKGGRKTEGRDQGTLHGGERSDSE